MEKLLLAQEELKKEVGQLGRDIVTFGGWEERAKAHYAYLDALLPGIEVKIYERLPSPREGESLEESARRMRCATCEPSFLRFGCRSPFIGCMCNSLEEALRYRQWGSVVENNAPLMANLAREKVAKLKRAQLKLARVSEEIRKKREHRAKADKVRNNPPPKWVNNKDKKQQEEERRAQAEKNRRRWLAKTNRKL